MDSNVLSLSMKAYWILHNAYDVPHPQTANLQKQEHGKEPEVLSLDSMYCQRSSFRRQLAIYDRSSIQFGHFHEDIEFF